MSRAILLSAAALLALSGCVSVGEKVKLPKQLYGLSAAQTAPAGPAVSVSADKAVLVAEPETERALAVPRIAVQMGAGQFAYMKDGMWSDRPARLFRNMLAETLRKGGKRLVLVDDGEAVGAGQRLSGRLAFIGYDAQRHAAVVRYDALRREADGRLSQRRFEAVEGNVAPRAEAVAPALNLAAQKVAGEVDDWLN
ncbi:ABC transporter [Novosphingobium umbonatum]|uniref:ABC transporter n=1 Tax=Novosphingobium umbonatum TaxID=1908524 RepID=A0A3S2V767_9SPHN|nr:ABC-type transport auxiliary lipoprotein family protein [Novosphingobium umbonatum]RVU05372.1 ABC transporter [Novosphingobium umbonatum]